MPRRIAIVHDSLTAFGGAERVLLAFVEMFPQADIYTSLATPELKQLVLNKSNGKLRCSKLSRSKLALHYPSYLKPYFYHYYWSRLRLDQYDLVISSSHSFCANWVQVKNKHISYIHTPPRFLYDEFNEMSWLRQPLVKKIFEPYWRLLRKIDQKNVQKIDLLIANSENVQNRIRKNYQLDSEVIYPPIKTAAKIDSFPKTKKTHYLFFSRLVKQKGIELVIGAFNKNQRPLLIVGVGPQLEKWQRMAKGNIEFRGFVPDQKMPQVYAQSKALVYASIQEDFGMAPVEAMSYGLPVIAYKDGGVKETVINHKTGLFFTKYSEETLNEIIVKFEQMQFAGQDCKNQARKFSAKNFQQKIKATIQALYD
jgi:glycosyltransferase involved in cell wall biosynthesis